MKVQKENSFFFKQYWLVDDEQQLTACGGKKLWSESYKYENH